MILQENTSVTRRAAWIRRGLAAWLLAVTVEYLRLPRQTRELATLEGLAQLSPGRILLLTAGTMLLLWLASRWGKTAAAERCGIGVVFVLYAAAAVIATGSRELLGGCLLIGLLLAVYVLFGWDSSPEPMAQPERAGKGFVWVTAALAVLFFLFVCVWTVCRVTSFSTPSYDFGIFSQMFYHMKETGLPMTTIERDGLLSHFHVHMSPIFYLLLPFYCLAPVPETLQVLQATVITSAVIPLWKLGKHHGLSGLQRTLLCAVLLLYPAFSGGTGYDIHENCFLTPLLLWLFYGIDRKNTSLTAIAAALTLTVKEDAAVYVAVIGLWLVVKATLRDKKGERWNRCAGGILLAASLAWFCVVTGYLANKGDGVMTGRYSNFMYDGSSSLVTVVKAVLLSPMKAVYECVDSEKLWFLAMTLLPLLGLPLLTRRYERYLLLIPYVLVNLMPDYLYQHDLFFQYTFGSLACLLYLTMVNLADLKNSGLRLAALAVAVAVSAGCFGAVIVPKAMTYPDRCIRYQGEYDAVRQVLSEIPADASVTATTFYTTYLSQRETLYDLKYASGTHLLSSQYVVIDLSAEEDVKKFASGDGENGFENLARLLEQNGYHEYASLENTLVIYTRP